MPAAPIYRRSSKLFTRLATRRNALAKVVREANGIFRERIGPNGRLYRRHPKHRKRAFAEAIAC